MSDPDSLQCNRCGGHGWIIARSRGARWCQGCLDTTDARDDELLAEGWCLMTEIGDRWLGLARSSGIPIHIEPPGEVWWPAWWARCVIAAEAESWLLFAAAASASDPEAIARLGAAWALGGVEAVRVVMRAMDRRYAHGAAKRLLTEDGSPKAGQPT